MEDLPFPNACATLWLSTNIFEFDLMPNEDGPVVALDDQPMIWEPVSHFMPDGHRCLGFWLPALV